MRLPDLLSGGEVVRRLGISPPTLMRLRRKGLIVGYRLPNGFYVYTAPEVESLGRRRRRTAMRIEEKRRRRREGAA